MVYFKVRSLSISHKNQVGYDSGGETIIFIGWIKFFSSEKHFSFFYLAVKSDSGYIPQVAVRNAFSSNIQYAKLQRFLTLRIIWRCILLALKGVKFYLNS